MKTHTPIIDNLIDTSLLRATLVSIPFLIMCAVLLPAVQAVSPAPGGGYPGGNTAEGQNALLNLGTGTFNTAIGLFSLQSATDGAFNTGIGAGALRANTASENTAIGAAALLKHDW